MTPATLAGRYTIERPLGHGGMATVYLARDDDLGRPVAVKLLAESLAADPEFRARFIREARAAARLNHPNVVPVFDAGEDGGRPYIVMEYVDGETLADVLRRRGRVPPEEAVDIVVQACTGLQHAHAAGIVHRDVKPRNLLLRTDGALKVVDFGIARAAEATRLTAAGTILGTVAYIAPEQAAGDDVTAAADVYSLGVVLYELLTGKTPYAADSLGSLVRRQAAASFAPVRTLAPQVSPALEAVGLRALASEPGDRPSAGELARELCSALGEAVTVPLDRSHEAPTRVVRPHSHRGVAPSRWAKIAALLVAVALALLVGLALLAGGNGDEPASPSAPESIQRGQTPEQQARNLADWLRRNPG